MASAEPGPAEDELAAERANTDHWRRVARQRTAALDALRTRPAVRLALRAERAVAPITRSAVGLRRWWRARMAQLRLALAAGPAVLHRRGRQAALDAAGRAGAAPAASRRQVAVVVVGAGGNGSRETASLDAAGGAHGAQIAALVHAAPRAAADGRPAESSAAAARRVAAGVDGDTLCFLLATTRGVGAGWLGHLVAALDAGAAAAAPVAVHPARPLVRATPHDLLVRSGGLAPVAGPAGPALAATHAGEPPGGLGTERRTVLAAGAACVVVDRAAYDAVGGIDALGDLDAAIADLCLRLSARGGEVALVPSSVVLDARSVPDRVALRRPLGPAAEAELFDRHGPRLRPGRVPGRLDIAFTVSAPTAKVLERWGDTHLAEAVAAGLRGKGHTAHVHPLADARSTAVAAADVHVVLRGLEPVARSTGQVHVLWVISHPEGIEDDECDDADLVLVASPRFAEALRRRTSTPVGVLLQTTDHHRFHPGAAQPSQRHPLVVVARTRDQLRPAVAGALAAGLRPAIHGSGWERLVDPALVVRSHVPNDELPGVYASAGVVLNDHWDTMRAWGFLSNRLFDVLATGTPVISDDLPEVRDVFGDTVPTYRTPDELRALVDADLADPAAARERAARGRDLVLAGHTAEHRARELLAAVAALGRTELDRAP